MDEEEASWCVISIARCLRDKHWGAPGCGGDVRLCHSQTCGVCVEGELGLLERDRDRGGRQEGCGGAAAWDRREGNKETSLVVQWLGCRTFTAGVKVGS